MADFCLDCSRRSDLPGPDIQANPGEVVFDLCEGCGEGWFDERGKRVEDDAPADE